jgi:hypothetical protein
MVPLVKSARRFLRVRRLVSASLGFFPNAHKVANGAHSHVLRCFQKLFFLLRIIGKWWRGPQKKRRTFHSDCDQLANERDGQPDEQQEDRAVAGRRCAVGAA